MKDYGIFLAGAGVFVYTVGQLVIDIYYTFYVQIQSMNDLIVFALKDEAPNLFKYKNVFEVGVGKVNSGINTMRLILRHRPSQQSKQFFKDQVAKQILKKVKLV